MREIIAQKLTDIERAQGVRILHAVESGSRAWGFASPDSDYDVRFIYVRDVSHYLKIEPTRDVIEWQLDETLDINGWDLQKALRLLHKSNPTLFEWASSPIVYKTTPDWARICAHFPEYFLSESGLRHYLNMAEGNYREYLKQEMVRIKKYLYVLRPLLACKWILARGTPPPMAFAQLVAAEAGPALAAEIDKLIAIKVNAPETAQLPRIEPLNRAIEAMLSQIKSAIEALPPKPSKGFGALDALFMETVFAVERSP